MSNDSKERIPSPPSPPSPPPLPSSSIVKDKVEAFSSGSPMAFADRNKIEEVRNKLQGLGNPPKKTFANKNLQQILKSNYKPAHQDPGWNPALNNISDEIARRSKELMTLRQRSREQTPERQSGGQPDKTKATAKKAAQVAKEDPGPAVGPTPTVPEKKQEDGTDNQNSKALRIIAATTFIAVLCIICSIGPAANKAAVADGDVLMVEHRLIAPPEVPVGREFMDILTLLVSSNPTIWLSALGMSIGSTVGYKAYQKFRERRERKTRLMRRAAYLLTGVSVVCLTVGLVVLKALTTLSQEESSNEQGADDASIRQRWLLPTIVGLGTFGVFSSGILGF